MYFTYQTEQPTEDKSYKGSKIYFITTDFPDCHSLLNTLFSASLTRPFEDLNILVE